jgi:hypothetical protein
MSIESYTNLFDRSEYGFNLNLAFAFLVATELSHLIGIIVLFLTSDYFVIGLPRIYIVLFALELLQAVFFCYFSFWISKDWRLPLLWGLVIALVGPTARSLMNAMGPEGFFAGFPFNTYIFGHEYIRGFVFMGGLILTVRIAQLNLIRFVSGMVVTMVCQEVIAKLYRFFFTLFHGASELSLELTPVIKAILVGLVFGVVFYYALHLHINRQKFSRIVLVAGVMIPLGITLGISIANADESKAGMQQAVKRAKELANQNLCRKNLRTMHKAVVEFQNTHNGNNPEYLRDLIVGGYLSWEKLRCPSVGQSEEQIDYIYNGHGLDASASSVLILAHDKASNHSPELRNILFVNGFVEVLNDKQYMEALNKDKQHRERN